MANSDRREHERIDMQMETRMWLQEKHRGKDILFEGFATTLNLAIGGTFLRSSYLLPVGFPINLEMRLEDDGGLLLARGQVTHKLREGEGLGPGMGIVFTAVDEANRERLLRFFISDRIRDFYQNRFVVEFPQLRNDISLKDVALIVNLWEDRDGRLAALKQASSGAPKALRPGDVPEAALPPPRSSKTQAAAQGEARKRATR